MAVISLMPQIFQRIRFELINAAKQQQWEKVRELDKRMGSLIDTGLEAPHADRLALSRELSLNMRVYKHILKSTPHMNLIKDHS